jgi:hypothetical protein
MEGLSLSWFSLYYPVLGILLMSAGIYILMRLQKVLSYLKTAATFDKPPSIWIGVIKYLFLFTIPCLILSFFPLSWGELIFSVWCLIIVYTAGQLLVHWKQTALAINKNISQLPRKIRFIAYNMLSLGFIMFLLFYHLQSKGAAGG